MKSERRPERVKTKLRKACHRKGDQVHRKKDGSKIGTTFGRGGERGGAHCFRRGILQRRKFVEKRGEVKEAYRREGQSQFMYLVT